MENQRTCRLAAVICVLSSPLVCFAADVLRNGGFEDGANSWSSIGSESTNVYEGSLAGRINQQTWWRQASQTVDCSPGQLISFGGYVKAEGIVQSGAGMRIKFYDASSQLLETWGAGSVSGDTGFEYLGETGILAPIGTVSADLELFVGRSTSTLGTAYFDSMFFDVFSHLDVIVNSNGGLENGFAGWYQGHASLVSGSDAYAGSSASRLTHGTFWKQSWYEFDCDPSQQYAVSFAAASLDATSSGLYQLRYYDSVGTLIATDGLLSLQGTNSYATYYIDGLQPPLGAETAKFYFAAAYPGTGYSYLDEVVISTEDNGLVSSTFIDQQLVNLMPNSGMEGSLTGWSSGVYADTTTFVGGTQSARINGLDWYKSYTYTMIPVTAGKYYSMSVYAKSENVAYSPTLTFRFYAADGTTLVGASGTLFSFEGTAPFREFRSDYALAPAGAVYMQPRIMFAKLNGGSKLWLDEMYFYESQNLPVRLVATYESISVYVSQEVQTSGEVAHIFYRETGETAWREAYEPVFDATRGEYRGSIIGLEEGTDYEVQVVLESGGSVLAEAGASVSTWDSEPVIAQTVTVASLYLGGQLLVENMHGAPDAWIKITGTGSNDINAGYADNVALLIRDSSYLIFENIDITGGRLHAVQVDRSDEIRILNCEMSGWARMPNYTDGKYFYETQADMTADRPINKDGAVHLLASSRVTVERCYMHDPRTGANNWEGSNHPAGPTAIYVENVNAAGGDYLRGNFVIRYNDMIGSDELRWNDAIEGESNSSQYGSVGRDSDVYGNMLAFGNDDGTELDGGQKNVRFFGNRIENCYVGLSLAPCVVGPSYVYRNLLFNSGDDRGSCYSVVKLGGGTTYSKGKSFFFHNTIYSSGNGLTGVGFGSDTNRAMFLAQTRNNIIRTLSSSSGWSRTIADSGENPWNDFDYDNLSTANWGSANVDYAAGQESNGILDDAPVFVNAAVGDFRLASSSSGIDDGLALFNFAEEFVGAAPDQGAYEAGQSSLFPVRPIEVTADKYYIELSGTANGSATPVDVTLVAGNIGSGLGYTVRMNDTVNWLSVSPVSGSLSSSGSQTLTFALLTSGLTTGEKLKATVLVKFDNGLSVPISIKADVL